jgi:hypothetical protein
MIKMIAIIPGFAPVNLEYGVLDVDARVFKSLPY